MFAITAAAAWKDRSGGGTETWRAGFASDAWSAFWGLPPVKTTTGKRAGMNEVPAQILFLTLFINIHSLVAHLFTIPEWV